MLRGGAECEFGNDDVACFYRLSTESLCADNSTSSAVVVLFACGPLLF